MTEIEVIKASLIARECEFIIKCDGQLLKITTAFLAGSTRARSVGSGAPQLKENGQLSSPQNQRTPDRPPVQTLKVWVKNSVGEGRESQTCTLHFVLAQN